MRVSPAGIGILAGSVLGITVIVLFVLLAVTQYSIEGTVQVDTGAYISPAGTINVDLILASVEKDLAGLTSQFQEYRAGKMTQAVARLSSELEQNLAQRAGAARTRSGGLSIEHVIDASLESGAVAEPAGTTSPAADTELVTLLQSEPAADEKEELQSRVDKYLRYALYCREMMDSCSIGNVFYRRGAEFWEDKAGELKEKGRVVYDDAKVNYITEWESYIGLGDEPVQDVSRTVRVDPAELAAAEDALAIPGPKVKPAAEQTEQPEPPAVSELIATSELHTAAIELERELTDRYQYGLRESLKLLRDKTIMSVQTDAEGRFVFQGEEVQPGEYIIYAVYDVLSAEGEPVEFTWFEPVELSLRRFAFNKTTKVNLNELNQSATPFRALYLPSRDEIYLQLIDQLQLTLENKLEQTEPAE